MTSENKIFNLPDKILLRIIQLLPQQTKVNVAETNYKLYKLVQKSLYANILFTERSILNSSKNFQDGLWTVVGGMKNPLVTSKSNLEMIKMRQDTHLRKVYQEKKDNEEEEEEFLEERKEPPRFSMNKNLLDFIKRNCTNLEQIFSIGEKPYTEVTLSLKDISNLPKLKRLDIADFQYLTHIVDTQITHLVVNPMVSSNNEISISDDAFSKAVKNLQLLQFNDYRTQSIFLNHFLKIWNPKEMLSLKSAKIIYYHGFNDNDIGNQNLVLDFLRVLNPSSFKNLEIVIGCDHMACNCLADLIKELSKTGGLRLRKLAVKQLTVHRDHNYSEKFDYYLSEFLIKSPSRLSLRFLSISYDVPGDFNIGNSVKANLETLVMPHFLENAACYEQVMSDLLWNGCKCDHCKSYLSIFDYYVMHHQYYDGLEGYMTDMITPVLFGSAGKTLFRRLINDLDLSFLEYPQLDTYWDFHTGNGITHFDDDTDSEDCQFNESCFKPLTKCLAHFYMNYVNTYGEAIPSLKRVIMNGEFFERKLGKTDEWICAYD
ncbi:hypothetical protein HII13_005279 [Brettanomyces bruxellensis]|nr:hypothetical protein HII13_005279 [Brettanomyces bruxellensis]